MSKPRRSSRREMHMKPRMPSQPLVDHRRPVRAQVVADQADVKVGGHRFVNRDQELLELHRTTPTVDCGDHRAIGDVERGEQARGAMPNIVVAAPLGRPPASSAASGPTPASRTHSTTTFSGGLWYRPTSTTSSTNNGSGESMNPSVRCGFSSNLRQTARSWTWTDPTSRPSTCATSCQSLRGGRPS
jgi:hypothetical protein